MAEQKDSDLKLEVSLPIWLKILVNQGPATAALVMLISVIVGWVPSPMLETLRANGQRLERVLANQDRMFAQIVETQQEMTNVAWAYNEYQNVLLRSICRNMVALQNQGQCDPRFRGYDEREPTKK